MEKQKYSTFYLMKKKGSFLTGIATLFDFGNNIFTYEYSESGREADSKAIENDWGVVGQDFKEVFRKFEKENSKVIPKHK